MSDLGDNRLAMLAAEVTAAHAGVLDAAKTAAERAIDAGRALLEAKELLKHGQWLPWLDEHCHLPERTAQLYMKIAKLGLEPEIIAEMGLNAAAQTAVFHYDWDPWEPTSRPASGCCSSASAFLAIMSHGSVAMGGSP
jgi:hypothetical protein